MKRDRTHRPVDDEPLGKSDFFRRVEAAEQGAESDWDETDASLVEEDIAEMDFDDELGAPDEAAAAAPAPAPAEVVGSTRTGSLAIPLGIAVAAAGAALATLGAAAPGSLGSLTATLADMGVTPFGLCLLGLVIAVFGVLQRQARQHAAEQEARLAELSGAVLARLESSRGDEGDVVGGDVDRVLVALQRQDEKINNLTRATKLYGKPLIEISNQVADVANHVQDTEAMGDAVRAAVAEAIDRLARDLGEQLRGIDQRTTELVTALQKAVGTVEDLHLEGVEATQKGQTELRRAIEQAAGEIREAVATARAEPADEGSDELERSLAAIQREVQSLATSLARIEARPAPSRAAEPAPSPAPASAPAAVDEAVAQQIAGERQASGKGVLGAIAKLKSMRN